MRGQLLISVFLGVIGIGVAEPLSNALVPYVSKCISEIDKDGWSRFISKGDMDDDNILRFHSCLWTEAGFLEDAKLNFPILEKVLTEDDHSKEGLDLFTALKICKATCEVSNDADVVLGKYLECFPTKMSG